MSDLRSSIQIAVLREVVRGARDVPDCHWVANIKVVRVLRVLSLCKSFVKGWLYLRGKVSFSIFTYSFIKSYLSRKISKFRVFLPFMHFMLYGVPCDFFLKEILSLVVHETT